MNWPRLSQTLALLAAGLGAFCFTGWVLEFETLKRLHSGWVTMKANTAVCLMLTGIAVALLREEHGPPWQRRLAHSCALIVITAADSVTAARLAIAEGSFDVVLSDLGLPDGTGLDVAAALREKSAVPAIAMSGYGMEADLSRSRAAGFNEHLVKPVTAAALRAMLAQMSGTITAPPWSAGEAEVAEF